MKHLQQRVDSGFLRAARKLGMCGRHYRVSDPLRPLADPIGTPRLCFDVEAGFRMRRPRPWGQAIVYAISDARDMRIGDLLEQGDRIYFVAETESLRPVSCVACNRLVTIHAMRGADDIYVQNCPASIRLTGKGEERHSGMPGSLRAGSYMMHFPFLPGFCLKPYMQVIDEIGARYLVDAVELSLNGTRAILTMQQV